MADPWFTVEVYAVLPGLIVGSAGGLYGVLVGLLINSKNFRQYFVVMTIAALIICIAVIAFGVIAIVYDQPRTFVYDFVYTGLLGMFVVIGVWYFVNKVFFHGAEKRNNGSS